MDLQPETNVNKETLPIIEEKIVTPKSGFVLNKNMILIGISLAVILLLIIIAVTVYFVSRTGNFLSVKNPTVIPTATLAPTEDPLAQVTPATYPIDTSKGFIFFNDLKYAETTAGFWYVNTTDLSIKNIIEFPSPQFINNYGISSGGLFYGLASKYYRIDLNTGVKMDIKVPECASAAEDCQNVAFQGPTSYVLFKYIDLDSATGAGKLEVIGIRNGQKYLDYKVDDDRYEGGVSTGSTEYIRLSPAGDKILVYSSFFKLAGSTDMGAALVFDNQGKLVHTFNSVADMQWLDNNTLFYQKRNVSSTDIFSFDLSKGTESNLIDYSYVLQNPMKQGNRVLTAVQDSVGQISDLYLIDLATKTYSKVMSDAYTTGWVGTNTALIVKMGPPLGDEIHTSLTGLVIYDLNTKISKDLDLDKFIDSWSVLPVSDTQPNANDFFAGPTDLE